MENLRLNHNLPALFEDQVRWRSLLNRFEDVLRVNIFMLDAQGQLLIAPVDFGSDAQNTSRWGRKFLETTFNFNSSAKVDLEFFKSFEYENGVLLSQNPFDFYVLGVPIYYAPTKILAHLFIGPVMLSKTWAEEKYVSLGQELQLPVANLLGEIRGIPHMSDSSARAVLHLLSEVIKNTVEMDLEKEKFQNIAASADALPREIANAAQDLYLAIQRDEMLVVILDEAINITGSEGGSLMILDEEKGELVTRVSRGLKNKMSILQSRLKIGEGIAGKAALEKSPLLIRGTDSEQSIRHLLKRPDIKTSLVVPLIVDDKVVGVLNLYTKTDDPALQNSLADVNQISAFIATALKSL